MRPPTNKPIHILHAHSKWSVLDGAATVDEYVEYAKANGLGACANTEHGMVLGLHDLVTKCHKAGIKPICGNEIYLMPRPDYQFKGKEYKYNHLTLWAQNEVGYKNLMAISSRSWGADRVTMAFGNPKPRVNWEDLDLYREGIICGSGCIEGPIAKPILRGEHQEAYKNAAILKDIFGDRLFFEVMPHLVDRNYHEEAVEVTNEAGRTFTFALSDTVDTPEGRMTVVDAMKKGVLEISDPVPARAGQGVFSDEPQRLIGKVDQSVYGTDPLGEENFEIKTNRRVGGVSDLSDEVLNEQI